MQQLPAKPATEVITDSMAAKPGHEADAKPVSAKPAIEVTTDFGAGLMSAVASEPRRPDRSSSASACAPYQEAIELGLSRGRNAMAIWQDLVDTYSFTRLSKRHGQTVNGGPVRFRLADYGKPDGAEGPTSHRSRRPCWPVARRIE